VVVYRRTYVSHKGAGKPTDPDFAALWRGIGDVFAMCVLCCATAAHASTVGDRRTLPSLCGTGTEWQAS